jgi:hypothetical protein
MIRSLRAHSKSAGRGADEASVADAAVDEELLPNGFEAKWTEPAGSVEVSNCDTKPVVRKADDFRTLRGVKIARYHQPGALPEPQFAHEFC